MSSGALPPYPLALKPYEEALRRYPNQAEKYRRLMHRGDPLADATVAAFARLPAGVGRRQLDLALDQGIEAVTDAPDELRALFAHVDDVPFWVNWEQLDRGGATFLRSGALGVLTIALASLPISYSSPVGNKPLVYSGRLLQRAPRRLGETGRFTYLPSLPGAMRRFGEGFKVNVKVRLMHAQVRRLLLRSGGWHTEQWGVPINQCYMAATNLMLSVTLLDGMRRFGLRFSSADREALLQLWRYSAYLCGVEPELHCVTEQEGRRLLDLVFDLEQPPDGDSLELIQSLMRVPHTVGWKQPDLLRQLFYGISYGLIGEQRAASLEYPRTAWRYLVPALRPLIRCADVSRRWVPGAQHLADRAGAFGWDLAVRATLGGPLPDFRLPQQLATRPAETPQ